MNHGYRSAEGDSRLAELAAATNIKNTKKHSFKEEEDPLGIPRLQGPAGPPVAAGW